MDLQNTNKASVELLAPAGNWECAKAAVANGADAIYFGADVSNARMRAGNFTVEELPQLMTYLHERGRKGFITLNTLIFTEELPAMEKLLLAVQRAGVDAAIMQDLGAVALARQLAPGFAVHASTQMTITSPEGLKFAEKLGITRAVLARELSLREIKKFQDQSSVPLEVFVHGALCVAYSGQCLTSESLGQRSANRGECAQACRLPYQMIVDGAIKDLGDKKYLLSPQDLSAIEEVPELIRLGVISFKIEGRLKTPEYVAAITRVYRKVIDATIGTNSSFAGNLHLEKPAHSAPSPAVTNHDRYSMEMAFSRGLFSGWMHGVNHQKLVHGRFSSKRGAFIGEIEEVGKSYVKVTPQVPVQPGDGIVFDTGGIPDHEQGGRVFDVNRDRLFFMRGKIDFRKLKIGDKVWKTDDPKLKKELRATFAQDVPPRKHAISMRVVACPDQPLKIEARCGEFAVTLESVARLEQAEKHPLDDALLRRQFSRLGNTPFELGDLVLEMKIAHCILPVSEINRLKREMVERFQNLFKGVDVKKSDSGIGGPRAILDQALVQIAVGRINQKQTEPILHVLCRSMEQLQAALESGATIVSCDFEDIRRYKDAASFSKNFPTSKLLLATPRIQKSGEQGFFKLIENAEPDGVLIRNLGALEYFKACEGWVRAGDFSLNVTNPLTAKLLMEERLDWLTVSYDLNSDQVLSLLHACPEPWFEIVLHQHMPMFHMEHCVFAAFLSDGTDHTNCGRPCDRHKVSLRDRVGIEHPLKADVGCRNTLFHRKAQSGARFWQEFSRAGCRRFRIELLDESLSETRKLLEAYRRLLFHGLPHELLFDQIKAVDQLGVTQGTLTVM